ncbi:hypothetical protein BESB_033080 [Besnoitia besnoiti]|uniref:Uncharacterized protein n=1 Tax=Besnoitia besnoiti TaxID=94643 RepID=A0A2A9LZ16_BESBE|nr:uncharacterized protein BESB_033080 [Besnoitia besnoiti]PFH31035.1 hypothetical protein BESB_033080 [Besnoitia besnoiti]
MGNAQSSSSSRGEQVTGATSAVPSSADLPCSREMVEYLQCVRTHPDGLTGAVDQCDTFRQNYKLCMAEYKKAKRGKANLQHRVLLGSFSRDPGTFAFGAHLQASWELFDPVSLSAARRAGRGFDPLDSAAGTQAETRAGTPRGRGEDGDFTARERGAATGATAESCAPYYRIFVTCYPQANICVYAVAQPGLLKAQQGGRAEEAAREGQRAAGRSAGGQERRNAVGRGSLGGAEEPPGDVSTPPDGERQSGGAQGGRSPAAPSSWTQRGGKAEARSQKKGGRSGASKRDGLSVSFEERGSEGTGGTQEARDCGGRRSSLRRRARERSSLLALQADSAARLFPPFLFNASSATFTSGESAGEDSEEDAVESPSYFGFPPAGRGGEEATARVSGPPPLGTKRIGGAGGTFTPATVAAALSTPSLLLQHRPASLRPLEIRFSAVLSLPVRGAAVACSPRHLIVGCARQPALLFLSLDGLRTVQAVIYLSDFLPRAEASSQVSARAEDWQQLGDAEEAAGRDRGADARAEAVGESQVGSTVETGKRGRQLGDEPTLQAERLHGESHEDGSDHGRSGENVKRAAEAAARRRQWERTARAAGDSNGSQGAADGCVSVPAGEQFASSCRPQERARGSRSSSLGSAPRSDSPNFCACGEFLFSPLGHATIEEVVRFEDRTEDVVLLPDLPDEALRDARAAADAHRHLEDLLRLASEEAKREVDRQPQSATHHGGGTELGTDEEDGAERGAPPSSSLVRTVRSLLHARHGGEAPEGLASCCSSSWDGAEDSGEHRVVTGDSEAEGAAGAESAAGPRIRGGLSNIAAALSEGVAQIALDARLSLLGVVTTHGRFFLLSWRAPLFLRPAQVGAANRSSNSASSPLASSSHSQGPGAGLDAERSTPHEGEGVGRHSPPIGILLRHHRVACCALNAERRLLALGLTNGEIELYSLDFSVSSSSAGSHASPAASACGRVERAQSPPGEGTAADAAALQGRDRAALPRGRCPCEVVRLVRRLNLRDACEGPEAAPQGRARGSRERFGRIEKEERAARSRTPSGASLLASGSSSSLRSGRQLFAAEGASRLFWGEDGRAEEGGRHRVETLVWSDDGLALAVKSRGRPRVASDAGEENDGEPPSGPGAPVAVFSYTGRLLLAPFSPPPPLPPRARSRSASSAASPLLSASAAPCAPSQASLMNGAAALAADVHGARMPLPSQGAGDLTPPPETRSVPLIPPVAHAPTCAWTGLGLGLIVSQEAEQRQANAVGEEEAWGRAVGGRRGSEDGFRRGSACARLLPPDVFEFPIFRSAWLGVGTTAVDSAGSRAASDAGDRILIGSSCLLLWAALPHLPASLSWSRIPLPPPMYLSPNWPIRQASLSPNEEFLLVSGTRGFAVFSLGQRRWRVLGDEQQERQLPTGLLPQGWYDPSIFFISIRTFDPDVSPVEAALAALAPLPVNSLSLSSPEHSKRLLSSLSSLPLPTPHLGRKPHAALAPAAAFSGGFSGVAAASQHPTAAEASPREHARASRSSSFLFGSPQPPLSALSSPRLPSGVSLPGWRGPRGSALAAEVSLERRAAQTPFCVSQQLPGMSLQERETWEAVLERLEVDSTSSAQLFTSPHVPSPQAAQGSPVSRASAASPLSGGEASAGRDNRGERGGGASTAAGFWSSKRQRAQKVTPKTGYALFFFDVRGRLAVENCVATVRALPARPLRTALLSTRQKPSANPPKRRGVRGAPARRLDAGTGRRAHVKGRGEGLQVSGGEQRRQCCRCGRRQAEARRRREEEGRQEDSSREDGEADAGRFEFDGHDGASTARYGGEGESSSDSEEGCALCKGLSEKEITGYLAAPPALNLATDAPILAVYDALHLITAYQLRPAAPRLPSSALSLSPDPPSYSSLHRTVSQPAGSAQPPAARCAPPRRAAERFPSLAAAGSTLHSRPSAATLASSPSSSAASASLPSSLLVGASLSTSLPICTYDVLALWQVDLSSCWVDHPLQIRFAASPALLVVLHAGGEVTALRLVSKEECGAALLREKAKGGEAEALQTKTVAAAIESRRHEKGVKFGEARPDQRQGISSRGRRLKRGQRSLHLVPQLVAQQSRAFGSGVTSLWLDPPAQLPFFCPLPARPIFALRDVSGLRRGLLSAQQGAASADGGAAACAEEDRPDVARDADAEAEWRGCVCAVCTVGGAAGESLGALGGTEDGGGGDDCVRQAAGPFLWRLWRASKKTDCARGHLQNPPQRFATASVKCGATARTRRKSGCRWARKEMDRKKRERAANVKRMRGVLRPPRLPPFSESRARPRVPPQTPASCVSSSLSAGGARASEGRDATEKGRRQREAERPAAAQRGESERGMAVEASSCSPRTATRPPAQPRPNASSGSGATAGSQERRTGVDGRERNELHVQEVERQRSGERHSASRRSHRWRGNEDLVLAGEDEAANPRHFRGSTSFGDHFCCPFTPLPSHPPLFALGRTRCGLSHSLPLSSSPLCSSSSISLSSLYPLDSHGGSSCGLPSPRSVTRVACSVSQGGEAACGAARTQGEREEMATTVREASGEPKQKDGSADEGVAKGDKNGEGGMAGHRGVEAVDSTRISAEESSQEETDAQLCSCSPCLEVETRSKRRGGSGAWRSVRLYLVRHLRQRPNHGVHVKSRGAWTSASELAEPIASASSEPPPFLSLFRVRGSRCCLFCEQWASSACSQSLKICIYREILCT